MPRNPRARMSSRYSAESLDLSLLPAPTLAETDYEARRADLLAKFKALWEAARAIDPSLPPYDVEMLETDPAIITTEEFAYGDIRVRQAINEAANALRLAKAVGADLDHITTTYHRTTRKVIVPANPDLGTAAVYESNEDLRSRAQLAPEALADMGLTPGGYVYKVRTAFADRIKHVFPINRGAGRVELRVLGRDGDGTVGTALLGEIIDAFRIEQGTQTTDVLTVLSAEVAHIAPSVTLILPPGPDPVVVKAQALASLKSLGAALHRINAPVYREALSAAAHVGSTITVRVNVPTLDRLGTPETAPFIDPEAITVDHEILP